MFRARAGLRWTVLDLNESMTCLGQVRRWTGYTSRLALSDEADQVESDAQVVGVGRPRSYTVDIRADSRTGSRISESA
jgi:hypothetical protein